MNAAFIPPFIVALAIGNTVASVAIWQIVTIDSAPQTVIGVSDAHVASPTEPHALPKRVERQIDPMAVRLFGSEAEIAKAAEVVMQDVSQKELEMRLVGIIIIKENNDELIALVECGFPSRVHRVRKGDNLGSSGWRVERIVAASVDLSKESELIKLDLNPTP